MQTGCVAFVLPARVWGVSRVLAVPVALLGPAPTTNREGGKIMVSADYLPLQWARQIGAGDSEVARAFDRGYILGFLNRDGPDWLTRVYVENVMRARARGVSA